MTKEKMTFLAVLSAFVMNAEAQSEKTEKTVDLNPVTVTGTGTYHKADNTPVAVKVITAKELKDAQASSLQDALSKLSSDITTSTNGMGTFVNFNGVSDDYIVILENGKRVSGDDRWNRISIDNIKRIEILSGSASALYGSDAIAGVINIITDESKKDLDVASRTRFSSKGRFDQDVNVDVTEGKFSSYTSYNHRQADNWQVNKYQEFMEGDVSVPKLTGRPMSQGFRSENISERLEYRFSEKFDAYVRGNLYDHTTLRPQMAGYYTQKATTDKETGEKTYSYTSKQAYTYDIHHQSYNVGAGARWVPNKDTHIYLDIYNDNFNSEYDYWQTLEAESYRESRKRTHYWNETLKGIFRLNSWNKLSGGIELVQENLKSASDNIASESMNTFNVFAQDEMSICKMLDAVVGFRYTNNSNFGSNFTPNAALFFHAGGFRLRASYAGGYRTPTLSQLYATDQAKTNKRYTLNNVNLKPEKNDFWNVNVEYSNDWVRASVSTYVNKIKDMINYRVMQQSEIDASSQLTALYEDGWTTIRQRDNIDKATIKGISANVKFLLPCGFTLGGGYTYTDSKAETMSLNTDTQVYEYTQTPVDKSVRNVANVNMAWDKTWGGYHLNVTLNGHIQGERYSSTYRYAPEYSQWDLNTKHTIRTKTFVIEPGIGIENIFNKRDTSYWNSNFSTINPGRALYVSLSLKY
ncbi:MAG: TonB-dependent receptor [Prevotellaceae bacterium]|nr:TonB-dependent receptor [Prevotellaceae bacterium]